MIIILVISKKKSDYCVSPENKIKEKYYWNKEKDNTCLSHLVKL